MTAYAQKSGSDARRVDAFDAQGTLQYGHSDGRLDLLGATPRTLDTLAWVSEHQEAVNSLLMDRGFVPLYKQLIEPSGGIKAAIMLGQAIGLTRTWLRREPSREDWFYLSAEEWQGYTGLSAKEQCSARECLLDAMLLEERRTYNPSRLYFKVRLSKLAQDFGLSSPVIGATTAAPTTATAQTSAGARAGDADIGLRWTDAALMNLLNESQMFFKPLADLAGGVLPGLLLSVLLTRQRSALRSRVVDTRGLFQIQYDALGAQFLWGAKSLRNARDQLRRAGLIAEEIRGTGPAARVHVGVNLAALIACLQVQPRSEMSQRVAAARQAKAALLGSKAIVLPAMADASIKSGLLPTIAGFRQSPLFQNSQSLELSQNQGLANQGLADDWAPPSTAQPWVQEFSDGALLSVAKKAAMALPVDKVAALLAVEEPVRCPFGSSDGALLSVAYTEIEYREPPPAQAREPSVDNFDAGSRRFFESHPTSQEDESALVFPAGVLASEAMPVIRHLAPTEQQTMLDELAGHMQSSRKTVASPLGLLHTLATKSLEGTLILTKAHEVARIRQARSAAPQARGTPQALAVPVAVSPEQVLADKARLRAVRQAIVSKGSLGALVVAESQSKGVGDDQ